MNAWALVPAKGFDHGKSRLRPALADAERTAFARALFEHVLDTLSASGAIAGVLVATDAAEVGEAARARGALVRHDTPGATSLAQVVDGALAELAARGADAAVVLMADLPQLCGDDVRALVSAVADREVVAVRAEDGRHTNALALAPPTCLPTSFGRPDSFAEHLATARDRRLRAAVLDLPRVAFDVDGPDDYARLTAHPRTAR